jgi:hypothetical protein
MTPLHCSHENCGGTVGFRSSIRSISITTSSGISSCSLHCKQMKFTFCLDRENRLNCVPVVLFFFPCFRFFDTVEIANHSQYQTIWEGLNILDYVIAPHYKSDHRESEDMDKAVEYMIDNKILFKALRDGEVIIIE